MSQVYALGAKIMCNNIAGLVNFQRQLCRENPDVMVSIGKGAKLGVEECQQQFKDQRWNCSTVARDVSVFGKVMRKGSKFSIKIRLSRFGYFLIECRRFSCRVIALKPVINPQQLDVFKSHK